MNIELKELLSLILPTRCERRDHGTAIVIADRGHVWVGRVVTENDWCTVTSASAIRQWGTTRGLGELASGGPTSKTVLDPVSEVRVASRAVIAVIPCEASKWKL